MTGLGIILIALWPIAWLTVFVHELGHALAKLAVLPGSVSIHVGLCPKRTFKIGRLTFALRAWPNNGWCGQTAAFRNDRDARRVYASGPIFSFVFGAPFLAVGLLNNVADTFPAFLAFCLGVAGVGVATLNGVVAVAAGKHGAGEGNDRWNVRERRPDGLKPFHLAPTSPPCYAKRGCQLRHDAHGRADRARHSRAVASGSQ